MNEEELREFEKIMNDYAYIRGRKSRGKLPKELEKELNNSQIGGVFKSLEDTEFDKKYKTSDRIRISKKFGNIDNFRKAYIEYMVKLSNAKNNDEIKKIKEESEAIIEETSKMPLVKNFYLGMKNKNGMIKFLSFVYENRLPENVVLDENVDKVVERDIK